MGRYERLGARTAALVSVLAALSVAGCKEGEQAAARRPSLADAAHGPGSASARKAAASTRKAAAPAREAAASAVPATEAEAVAAITTRSPADAASLARSAARRFTGARAARDLARAANSRGHALYIKGALDGALPLFEAAAAIDSTYGMPRFNSARVYARKGDREACLRYLGQLKAMGPGQRRRLNHARKDPAFASLRASPDFRALFVRDTTVLALTPGSGAAGASVTLPEAALPGYGSKRYLVDVGACQTIGVQLTASAPLAIKVTPPPSEHLVVELLSSAAGARFTGAQIAHATGRYAIALFGRGKTRYTLKVTVRGRPGQVYEDNAKPALSFGDLAITPRVIAFGAGGVFGYTPLATPGPCKLKAGDDFVNAPCDQLNVSLKPLVPAPESFPVTRSLVLKKSRGESPGLWVSFCPDPRAKHCSIHVFYPQKQARVPDTP